jgi:hypothetical protein
MGGVSYCRQMRPFDRPATEAGKSRMAVFRPRVARIVAAAHRDRTGAGAWVDAQTVDYHCPTDFCNASVRGSVISIRLRATTTMSQHTMSTAVSLTEPTLLADSSICFSAYGFGWGYCAFSLSPDAVCEKLGAANASPKQLVLAFELSKHRLMRLAEQKYLPQVGERITLAAGDLQCRRQAESTPHEGNAASSSGQSQCDDATVLFRATHEAA